MSKKYGLISETDAYTIERTLDLICEEFNDEVISTCEIGIYSGQTSKGICEYIESKGRKPRHIGIDNSADNEMPINFPPTAFLISGNSSEVYYKIEDESQHFIFVDGDHSFPAVVADFFCYAPKIKVGGYFAFHDTGKHIKPFKDYQKIGSDTDPDMYISVRRALKAIGALDNDLPEWRLIFDVEDINDTAGGVVVLKKVKYEN